VQQKKALQKLLESASDHIEELVAKDGAEQDKAGALEAAAKFAAPPNCESIARPERD
jgi:hypothetical protein